MCRARVSFVVSYLCSVLSLFRRKVAKVVVGGLESLFQERLPLGEFFCNWRRRYACSLPPTGELLFL